jgi:hypothetical protein
MLMSSNASTDLYRYYDADGQLLYVGISLSAVARASQHRSEKGWWRDVARMTVEHLPSRAEAVAAELEAIRTEAPIHNVAGNGETIRRYGPKGQYSVTVSPKHMNPWACMYCGRGCGKSPQDAFIQVDNSDYWWVLCSGCDDNPNPRYWIDASRVADVEAVERWTDHLSYKNWFDFGSWYQLIETHCNIVTAKEHAYAAIEARRRRTGQTS